MKYFLLSFVIQDGVHEHYSYITTQAEDEAGAIAKGETQQHEAEMVEDEDKMTMFDYGDGETTATLKYAKEITEDQMKALDETGVANFYEL